MFTGFPKNATKKDRYSSMINGYSSTLLTFMSCGMKIIEKMFGMNLELYKYLQTINGNGF